MVPPPEPRAGRARHALFPGTFDPVTEGHLDLVRRALHVFERVTVAVATNPEKRTMFSGEERVALVREATAGLEGVHVEPVQGLVVDACARLGAGMILRGVRSGTDFDYEFQMASTNRALAPDVDTFLIAAAPEHAHLSSTLVRQIATFGGDPSPFVPPCVVEALRRRASR